MARERILVVEDDEDILELISYNLSRENYSVTKAESGEDALEAVSARAPDLILLDLMLPELDGLEVCRRLKANGRTRPIPIVIVSAKGEEPEVVAGLELGADDYITKPFRPKELVARVRAVLRRGSTVRLEAETVLAVADLHIDPKRREVRLKGKPVELTYTEFQILQFLAQRPGWVFTRSQIVDAVRGENYAVTDRSVDVQIVGLRKKLGKASGYIETVRGIGYRFKDESP
ncbi:MAG: response regulator transcription factor [Kiritimatiellae bacterium]|nr:response regulator transcription factor [Kiritimatiellia bacterium]